MIRIEIATENAAFDSGVFEEVARILEEIVADLRHPACTLYVNTSYPLRDSNGTTVGTVQVLP